MFPKEKLEQLVQSLIECLPKGAPLSESSIHEQFKSILQSTLARLDIVTREEFDVQCRVLSRTREKLEALEQKLNDLKNK